VFGFEKEAPSKKFASAGANMLDLESFMDNDDNLNNVYGVEVEVKEDVNVLYLDSQTEKESMFEKMCQVTKLREDLNNRELAQLETARHMEETKTNFCCRYSNVDHSFLEDLKKRDDRANKYMDKMTCLNYDKQDIDQERVTFQYTLERLENKLDCVVTVKEKQECRH
jgi:hypothetical protein